MLKMYKFFLLSSATIVLAACSTPPATEQATTVDSISLATSDPVEEPIGDLPEHSDTLTLYW